MKYVGSKNRLAKELVPIIQSYIKSDTKGYLEPFVGGANMIDKIQCSNKIGCDIHEELIELLKYTQAYSELLPIRISEEQYNEVKDNKEKYEKWYVGLVGFCATFSAKWFGGYARSFKSDGITPRDMSYEAISNLKKQAHKLKNIKFIHSDFLNLDMSNINNYVIYCDIPYKGTTKYKTESFPYDRFYDWVRKHSKDNTILVSEYDMPDDFQCIWSKEHKTLIDSNKTSNDEKNIRIERLFIHSDSKSQ